MSNRKRHPDYMTLKSKIKQCHTATHLDRLRQVVLKTNSLLKPTKWKEDGTDLMILFLQKETELNPYNL